MFGLFKKTQKSTPQSGEGFWPWFVRSRDAIAADVLTLGTPDARLGLVITEVGRRLKAIHPSLVHEIGPFSPEIVEIIISADGDRSAFPTVLALVREAPNMPGVKVTAFRQRNPNVSLEIFGQKISAQNMRYVSHAEGDRLGLDIFIDADLTEDQLRAAGFIMLDQVLGEYDVETAIGSIQFHRGIAERSKPLGELPGQVDARRPARLH